MTEKGRRTWNFYFNSHPHEEDDDSLRLLNCHADISTHILTKRMTVFLIGRHTNEGISTHILTKRMTKGITVGSTVTIISTHILTKRMTQSKHGSRKWQLNFNSHPHEEDDHHPLLSYTSQYHFNSHPHEEDDVE